MLVFKIVLQIKYTLQVVSIIFSFQNFELIKIYR